MTSGDFPSPEALNAKWVQTPAGKHSSSARTKRVASELLCSGRREHQFATATGRFDDGGNGCSSRQSVPVFGGEQGEGIQVCMQNLCQPLNPADLRRYREWGRTMEPGPGRYSLGDPYLSLIHI